MKCAFFISLIFLSQTSIATVNKKLKKIDLGLVRKTAAADIQFKPETDPNKRDIQKERYSTLDVLDWQNADALSAQKAVTEQHNSPFQFQQQQVFNQAMQNLPRITIPALPTSK
jgi:hypothetical protein